MPQMETTNNRSTQNVIFKEIDTAFEESVVHNRYSLKAWLRYLDHKKSAPPHERFVLYQRALVELPSSYKLWHAFLSEKLSLLTKNLEKRGPQVIKTLGEETIMCFHQSLAFMHKMPVIWLMFCKLLESLGNITRTRRAYDQALQSLPITQHDRVWNQCMLWLKSEGSMVPIESQIKLWKRYTQLESGATEEYIDFLIEHEQWEEAAERLSEVLSYPASSPQSFESKKGLSRHQLWLRLCDIITEHPECSRKLKVEAIIRQGLSAFRDHVGRIWTCLANFYIRQGNFEKARDVLEEALTSVISLQDFLQVWNVYVEFEQRLISDFVHSQEERHNENTNEENQKENATTDREEKTKAQVSDKGKGKGKGKGGDQEEEEEEDDDDDEEKREFQLRVARMEYLLDRRQLLINAAKLRQNPHNVIEWHNRVQLYTNPRAIVDTYSRAIKSVDPFLATGKPHTLWCNLARFYASHGDINSSRQIFEKAASEAPFRTSRELACVWSEWIEFELKQKQYDVARKLLQRATQVPPASTIARANSQLQVPVDQILRLESVQKMGSQGLSDAQMKCYQEAIHLQLHRSTQIWSLYADFEESMGTLSSTRAVYDRIIDLKVASPQIIINYARILEENNYFEESFRVFEKGVHLFNFPYSMDIWICYLTKFISRYHETKLERARDLFEQVLESAPKDKAKYFYVLYAELEEKHGLARHAMSIYDRAARQVADNDKLAIFQLYISKATEFFGVTRTREIYEKAIETLPDRLIKPISLQYARLERKLGEIDRSRSILSHCSQFCDPRIHTDFWNEWQEFEVHHGNPDTYREMLRIKRSVQALHSSHINLMTSQLFVRSSLQQKLIDLQGNDRETADSKKLEEFQKAVLKEQEQQQQQHSRKRPREDGNDEEGEGGEREGIDGQPELEYTPKTSSSSSSSTVVNSEEVSLDDEEQDDGHDEREGEGEGKGVGQKKRVEIEEIQVPEAVFGGAKKLGALERFKKQQ